MLPSVMLLGGIGLAGWALVYRRLVTVPGIQHR
jgi:hypothetical protein